MYARDERCLCGAASSFAFWRSKSCPSAQSLPFFLMQAMCMPGFALKEPRFGRLVSAGQSGSPVTEGCHDGGVYPRSVTGRAIVGVCRASV